MPLPKPRKPEADAPFCLTHNVQHKINKAMCRVEVNRSANPEIHKCERHGEHCRLHWNTCKDRRPETVQSAALRAEIQELKRDTIEAIARHKARLAERPWEPGVHWAPVPADVDPDNPLHMAQYRMKMGWNAWEVSHPVTPVPSIEELIARREERDDELVREPVKLEDIGLEVGPDDDLPVVDGVVLDPVEHFIPSLQIRKKKRPRPNPYQPRVINPSFDDLAEEWR